MKSLHALLKSALHDCSAICRVPTSRDYLTLTARVKDEGLSFLMITLPTFGADFERSLSQGYIGHGSFRSFGKIGVIPKLFSGMLRQIFDMDGRLLDKPSIAAIVCIRQVCLMWKKMLVQCSTARVSAAIDSYVKLEETMPYDWSASIPDTLYRVWEQVADLVISSLGSLPCELLPRHGTGAVAEKILPNQKYLHLTWPQRLDQFFPASSFAFYNANHELDSDSDLRLLSPEQELPVRVVTVPKTLKGPRVIGIEPVAMQYCQQALLRWIVPRVNSSRLTAGSVNFLDQSINASLALQSSKDGLLATLDLKDASDRVHSGCVYRLLKSNIPLRDAVFSCRSTHSTPLKGLTIPLKKFASMGSALCFPMEALVFYTILLSVGLREYNLPPSVSSLLFLKEKIHVYGDDLVLPVDWVPSVMLALDQFGLRTNTAKSFWTGKFRESCGTDAYDGIDCTPVYLRRLPPTDRDSLRAALSLVDFGNQALSKGFFSLANTARRIVLSYHNIPDVSESSSSIGFKGYSTPKAHRVCKKLHVPLVKGYVIQARSSSDVIDGWEGLMKWHQLSSREVRLDYVTSKVPGVFTIKRQWCRL